MLPVWRPQVLRRAQQEERRLYGHRLLDAGESTATIAQALGVAQSTVRGWKNDLRDHGPAALQATRASGRPTALSVEQRQVLRLKLCEGPQAHGWADARWTTKRVHALIGHEFGVWQHPDHVRKVLHQLGFSCQKPETRALERNERAIATWVETVRPELEKKDRRWHDRPLHR